MKVVRPKFTNQGATLFAYFTLIIVLVLLAGFAPLYFSLSASLSEQLDTSTEVYLQQVISNVENYFERLEDKELRICTNTNLEMLFFRYNNNLYGNPEDYYRDVRQLSRDLYIEQMDDNSIQSIYLYLHGQELIISANEYQTLEMFPDGDFLQNQLTLLDQTPINKADIVYRTDGVRPILSIVRLFGLRGYRGLLVINLEQDFFAGLTDTLHQFSDSAFLIADEQNHVIASSFPGPVDYAETGLEPHAGDIGWEQDIEGTPSVVLQRMGGDGRWKYVMSTPRKSVFSALDTARNVALVLLAACLGTGLGLSLYLSRRYYRPIARLAAYVRSNVFTRDTTSGDLALIRSSVERLFDENLLYSKRLHEHWESIQNQVLLDFLKGNYHNAAALCEAAKAYEIDFVHPVFQVAVLELYDSEIQKPETEADENLTQYAAANIAYYAVSEHHHCVVVRIELDRIAIVFNTPQRLDADAVVICCRRVQQAIWQSIEVPTSFGVGQAYASAELLSISYQQAVHVVNRIVYWGTGSIVLYENVVSSTNTTLDEDAWHSLRDALLQAVKGKQHEQVHTVIDRQFDLIEATSGLSPEYIRFALRSTLNDAIHLLYQLFGEIPPQFEESSERMAGFQKRKDMKSYRTFFYDFYDDLLQYIQDRSRNRRNETVDAVLAYIRAHYDQDLSLEIMADKVQLNPKYLGRLIKNATNKTYPAVLNEVRIEQAKELLLNPKLKVSDIYMRVGFQNRQSFYRAFSSYTGMTPTEYREKQAAQ